MDGIERVQRDMGLSERAHNYCSSWGSEPGVVRSARLALRETGQSQAIHMHVYGGECVESCVGVQGCYVMTVEDLE